MTYDPLKPPAWVRQAMRDRSHVIKVNPNNPASFDRYIEDLAARAPAGWHAALARIVASAPATPPKRRRRT